MLVVVVLAILVMVAMLAMVESMLELGMRQSIELGSKMEGSVLNHRVIKHSNWKSPINGVCFR